MRLTFLALIIFCTSCDAQTPDASTNYSTNLYSGADSILNFVLTHKNKSSMCVQKNGKVIARVNENKVMPLASAVKIMVAVEFAKQVGAEVIDEEKYVALSELGKYYLPNTDGNAHPQWLSYEKLRNHIKEDSVHGDSVKLIDVARGMMMFSSNANTEYLMDILGFDNIKNNVTLFGLKKHTAIYPLVSSLFMYQNPFEAKPDKIWKEIHDLTEEQYCKYILKIHAHLKWDSMYKKKFRPYDLTPKMQKLWSDRLPSSTTAEYAKVCQAINNRNYFDENTYGIISDVLETIMENPANQAWIKHAGTKGGSTMYVLTEAFYATLKDDTKYEIAIFFNDLVGDEFLRLSGWINDFRLKVLRDEEFRNKLPK